MILFKSCPRCSGDRTEQQDLYGPYIICLACGFVSYPENSEPPQPVQEQNLKSA